MNILGLADLHGRIPKLPANIRGSHIDLLAFCGDCVPNFDANWNLKSHPRQCDVAKEAPAQQAWVEDRLLPWVAKEFSDVTNILYLAGNHCFFDPEKIKGIIGLKTGSRTLTINGTKIGLLAGSMPLIGEWSDEVDDFEMNSRILNIEPNIEILFSHVPPLGIMDRSWSGQLIGCKSLRDACLGITSFGEVIEKPWFTKLQHHFYGHCHETRGSEVHEVDDRKIMFHNVAETYSTLEHQHQSRVAFHSK
jgi:Icc-related predicted phosphoesterase